MTQALNGGAQNLNAGSTLVAAPANTANGLELAAMSNVAFLAGVGRTWQNMLLPSVLRVSGTPYTNTTGRDIQVNVWPAQASSGGLSAVVAGVTVATYTTNNTTSGANGTISFIVPAGAIYTVTVGATTITGWAELR